MTKIPILYYCPNKSNYIESYWDNDQGGGVKRKYYKITDNGKIHLNNKIKERILPTIVTHKRKMISSRNNI